MISSYNGQAPPVNNLAKIVGNELKIFGFIVPSLYPKYLESFYKEVPKQIASGEIKYTEDITQGLEYGGQAIESVQRGTNTGKSVIRVAEE